MKIFQQNQLNEAKAYAAAGGQALHLFSGGIADAIARVRKIPNCFRGRRELAHLLDQDRNRLEKTARKLGVRVVLVDRPGTPWQHVDLCGGPLAQAKNLADRAVLFAETDPAKLTRLVLQAFLPSRDGWGANPAPAEREFKQEILGEFFDRSPANTEGAR